MSKISQERKIAQEHLRKQYNYKTNNNFGKGVVLIKEDAFNTGWKNPSGGIVHILPDGSRKYKEVTDLQITIDNIPQEKEQILLTLVDYKDYKDERVKISEKSVRISLDELDIIQDIACALRDENKEGWINTKNLKK